MTQHPAVMSVHDVGRNPVLLESLQLLASALAATIEGEHAQI